MVFVSQTVGAVRRLRTRLGRPTGLRVRQLGRGLQPAELSHAWCEGQSGQRQSVDTFVHISADCSVGVSLRCYRTGGFLSVSQACSVTLIILGTK